MIQIPIDIQGVTVWRDVRSNRWTIQAQEQTYTLHEWKWGQRHQLVRTAVVSGRFEPELFIDSVFELLLEPMPASNRDRYACLSLHLLGVPEHPPAVSLARAELLLAQVFGWRPTDLADQPAAALDDMVQTLAAQDAYSHVARPRTSGDEGWISIVVRPDPIAVEPDPNITPRQAVYADAQLRMRLQHMLDAVAAWAGLSPEPAQLEEHFQASASIAAQNPKTTSANRSSYPDSDDTPGNEAEFAAKDQPPENSGQRGKSGWPDRFGGTARLKTGTSQNLGHETPEIFAQRTSAVYLKSGIDPLKPTAISSTPHSSSQHPGNSPLLSTTSSHSFARAGQPPYGPDNQGGEGRTKSLNSVHSTETKPAASAGPWGGGGKTDAPSSSWPNLTAAPQPHKSWEPLSATLPRQHRWEVGIGVSSDSVTQVEVAAEAASKPAQPHDWNEQPTYEPKMASIAIQEGYLETMQDTLALAGATFENPFALSEFEERLADVLERAAREAGIDLP